MPPLAAAAVALVALAAWPARAARWQWGRESVLAVDAPSNWTLRSSTGGVFLTAGPPFVVCGGSRFRVGAELREEAGKPISGVDPRLGAWSGAAFNLTTAQGAPAWSPPAAPGAVVMRVAFRYFAGRDAFLFDQSLPLGCATGFNASALPANATDHARRARLGDPGAVTSPSTGFPVIDLAAPGSPRGPATGYMQWRGVFSDLQSTRGTGLSRFLGGPEAGPLALFPAATARGVTVLSAADDFFRASMGLVTCRENGDPAPTCSLRHGVDFERNDVGSITAPTVGACCAACVANRACTCFSYVDSDSGPLARRCWMKRSTAGAQNSTHVSGVVCDSSTELLALGAQGYEQAALPGASLSFVVSSSGATGGVRDGMGKWGALLTSLHATSRLGDDIMSSLAYGTDNGAYYSGHLVNISSADLVDAAAALRAQGLPVRYMQLDPWWFRGQPGWEPDPATFPRGLVPFRKAVGLPLLLYSFMWSPGRTAAFPPYASRGFGFFDSRTFISGYGPGGKPQLGRFAQSNGTTSAAFYEFLFRQYHDEQEVMVAYETDFMDRTALYVDQFMANSSLLELWQAGQDAALLRRGMPWQHCMSLPSFALDALKRPSITNSRGTTDASPVLRNRWRLAYTSAFYWAIGLRPFFDNIWTTTPQPGNWYNRSKNNIDLDATIAVMSAGPVWIGDKAGMTNAALANRTCRADGALLWPSAPLMPIDAMYASPSPFGFAPASPDTAPEVWVASSDLAASPAAASMGAAAGPGSTTPWVPTTGAAPPAGVTRSYDVLSVDVIDRFLLQPSELWPSPAPGVAYVASPHNRSCVAGNDATDCGIFLVPSEGFNVATRTPTNPGNHPEHGFATWTLSPVLLTGCALLGETAKIVRLSPRRFSAVAPSGGGIQMTVTGSPGERVSVLCACGTRVMGDSVTIGADGIADSHCGPE